jgi:hypothetical protein
MREAREVWGYEVHGALVWDNAAQREAWRGTRAGSTIGDQRWSDWGGYANKILSAGSNSKASCEQRAKAKGLPVPAENDNPSKGRPCLSCSACSGIFTGDLLLDELRAFATDSGYRPRHIRRPFFRYYR